MTAAMDRKGFDLKRLLHIVSGLLLVSWVAPPPASAQALFSSRLSNGTELLHIALPLADATTVAWPVSEQGQPTEVTIASGKLTLAADLEAALGGDPTALAPPVVVAVGGAPAEELRRLVERLLAGRPVAEGERPISTAPAEGGIERRLGPPGAEAVLRLAVVLPAVADWRRSSMEVLWEVMPALAQSDVVGLQSRIEGETGVLEARVDPELADVVLRRLRLALARIAADPQLDSALVERAIRRLRVRRRAATEEHPSAAQLLLATWRIGGTAGVRQYVFGLDGVTLDSVRETARDWLAEHPGAAVLVLPPRVFSPRFAPAPQLLRLDNDLSAAVLERPSAPLSVVCVRPVLLADVDGELSATVLVRLAAELRSAENAPGWVRVRSAPPLLELAAPLDGFAELIEVLRRGLDRLADDNRPVRGGGGDARRRALRLMGQLLGLDAEEDLNPAALLRSDNLALGVVAADAEAAVEALGKFLATDGRERRAPRSDSLAGAQRTREATSGAESALVVALELPLAATGIAASEVLAALLRERLARIHPQRDVEILRPLVPGRHVMLLVMRGRATLDVVEEEVAEGWSDVVEPTVEAELGPLRRRVAARVAIGVSGSLGRGRTSAAIAAGAARWQPPAEIELEILMIGKDDVNAILGALPPWDDLDSTGAGVLPIDHLPAP